MRSFITWRVVKSIVRMMQPRKMRWALYVARVGAKRIKYRILVENLEGKRPFG
jgi:hypothetical protein